VTFWDHFCRLLFRRPVPALAALYWHLTRRRVRARNRLRVASADLAFAYDVWIAANEVEGDFEAEITGWTKHPRFAVLPYADGQFTDGDVTRSIASVEQQIYPYWTILGAPTDSLASRWSKADTDYVIPLRIGDALSPAALFRFAKTLQTNDGAAVLYGDQDQIDPRGRRRRPWFKPEWNEEMFLAQDYLSDGVAIEVGAARAAAALTGGDLDDVLLAATFAASGPIVRVPHIVSHVAAYSGRARASDRLPAVSRQVAQMSARCTAGPFGTVKVEWPLPPNPPLVTIIVPTRDKLDLLRPCLESVLGKTDYGNFEVLVLDNESVEQRTLDYLADVTTDPRVRVVQMPGSYNFSIFNNFAARQARGAYICLLNNDTEVLEPAWLTEMMRYSIRSNVGAVGAKLLYDDGSIQHAGVVVGIGEAAGHAHRFLPASDPGYFRMAHVSHYVSAITAACLVVDKEKFAAVGGLDEELAVAFNDVDLCLKLQAAGWRNVYVPHAVLLHHESKSRGKDAAPQNIQRYLRELAVLQDRWGTKTYDDPLHNPNLDRHNESFVLKI
jgi:GT2 family glycosyltransferase